MEDIDNASSTVKGWRSRGAPKTEKILQTNILECRFLYLNPTVHFSKIDVQLLNDHCSSHWDLAKSIVWGMNRKAKKEKEEEDKKKAKEKAKEQAEEEDEEDAQEPPGDEEDYEDWDEWDEEA